MTRREATAGRAARPASAARRRSNARLRGGRARPRVGRPRRGPCHARRSPRAARASRVNSVGMTNFVAGLAPSALSASRYWSAIVFSSMPRAAPKIRVSASLKPSARRIAACRSPSALRISDCFWPSATLIAACRVPSDSVMTARRVRSAESCRFIASWTSRGGVISRISTVVTLPPQRSVTSSSLTRRTSLICSRFESTSSRRMSPMTARSVVVATPWRAPGKFATLTTLLSGSRSASR